MRVAGEWPGGAVTTTSVLPQDIFHQFRLGFAFFDVVSQVQDGSIPELLGFGLRALKDVLSRFAAGPASGAICHSPIAAA